MNSILYILAQGIKHITRHNKGGSPVSDDDHVSLVHSVDTHTRTHTHKKPQVILSALCSLTL